MFQFISRWFWQYYSNIAEKIIPAILRETNLHTKSSIAAILPECIAVILPQYCRNILPCILVREGIDFS